MWSKTTWTIVRWTHLIAAFATGWFLYASDELSGLDPAKFLFFPLLLLTGIWLQAGRMRAERRRGERAAAAETS